MESVCVKRELERGGATKATSERERERKRDGEKDKGTKTRASKEHPHYLSW